VGVAWRACLGVLVFLAAAGCAQRDPTHDSSAAVGVAPDPVLADDVAVFSYRHDLAPDADPPAAAFDVPPGAENLTVVVETHGAPCGGGVGLPDSRGVAMTLTSPSGHSSTIKVPSPGACVTPTLDVSGYAKSTLDAEAGHWTVVFNARGVGAEVSVSALAKPPSPEA